jgi:hypothetical protein
MSLQWLKKTAEIKIQPPFCQDTTMTFDTTQPAQVTGLGGYKVDAFVLTD